MLKGTGDVATAARRGLVAACVLAALAVVLPLATGWHVLATDDWPHTVPPLHTTWRPTLGIGTPLALVVGALGVAYADRLTARLSWRRLLLATYAATLAWTLSLALVYGPSGLSRALDLSYEYLATARTVHDVPGFLSGFVDRIPFSAAPYNWPIHVAGHPPGATLFFVALVRLGLGSSLAAGCVVTLIGTTVPVAVLVTLRRLGAERAARLAVPFLVLGPSALWVAVSGDAVFSAVAAWGLATLAVAATTTRAAVRWPAAVLAGLLLGSLLVLSYGLGLFGLLALVVLWLTRGWRLVPVVALTALVPTLLLAGFGFYLWEAYPVMRQRYWDGLASARPWQYWTWASLGSLALSAGPALGAGLGAVAATRRTADRAVRWLVGAAASAVVLADASQMSKAEVERIWLPFVPWLLLSAALLPPRWRRPLLALQVVVALLLEHLLDTTW
jgi:methylthioxylose transferase